MKILHVLDHSLPIISGYSLRSDYILRAQRRLGLEVAAVTSPKQEDAPGAGCELIDGIEYHRVPWPALDPGSRLQSVSMFRQMATVAALSRKIADLASRLGIDVIHAHSPALCGMAASRAARGGIPWIYDLRYYDEDAAVDRGKTRFNSLRYRTGRRLELAVLREAPRVAVIGSALRDDLVRRGINPDLITVAPNGVDTDFFRPAGPDAGLVESLRLGGRLVVGFIGSFYAYEGVDLLIDAVSMLMGERRDLKLLLVGEGESETGLRAAVPSELASEMVFAGRVDHDRIAKWYSVMDLLVYPRIRSRLTELTTPLKPLEAMAMGKAVVASDVGGLRELVRHGETGLLVEPGSRRLLADSIRRLLDDRALRERLGRNAREDVEARRQWLSVAERYLDIYRSLAPGKTLNE